MTKNRYYAIHKGHRPGIYTQWTGQGGAEEQIKGYPGAVYRGFASREQAAYFLATGQSPSAVGEATLFQSDVSHVSKPSAATSVEAGHDAYLADLAAGKVVIFTDGASTGNPGPGGYGAVLLYKKARKELSGGFLCTTNNRMEMQAVITALQALKQPSEVVLYSDSRYVVDAVEKGWAKRWRSRGWMRTTKDRAENADLWAVLLGLLEQHQVAFRWVRGHASHPENERCDQLAVQAAHQPNLPPDPGYQARCP